MPKCSEMQVGDVYKCASCGLELEVKKECDCGDSSCSCSDIECCGSPMSKA